MDLSLAFCILSTLFSFRLVCLVVTGLPYATQGPALKNVQCTVSVVWSYEFDVIIAGKKKKKKKKKKK